MINLMDYDYNELIKGITYRHTIYFIKSIFETNKNFILIEYSGGKYLVFEMMSFVKSKDDIAIILRSFNNKQGILCRSSFDNVVVFYERDTFLISTIKLLNSFDDALEYLV